MKLPIWTNVLLLVVGLSLSTPTVSAQSTASLKAQLDQLQKDVAKLAAMEAPLATSVQELSAKVAGISQKLEQQKLGEQSTPDALKTLSEQQDSLDQLRQQVEYLRTNVAGIEQTPATSDTTYKGGMHWSAQQDGRLYSMTLGGYLHTRLDTQLAHDFSTMNAGFRARRGRLTLKGHAGSERLQYAVAFELTGSSAPLLDFYSQWKYRKELQVRLGQAKTPFTRSLLASSKKRIFFELSKTQDLARYARDVGVWVLGTLWDERIYYHAGFGNGSGRNQRNDNIDVVSTIRVESPILGAYIKPGYADVQGTQQLALTVGAAFAHDLVALPSRLGNTDVENRDVDRDTNVDNIRVLSSVVDAQLRLKGFELTLEGTWRHERWGKILLHEDNSNIQTLVNPSNKGRRNYLGITAQASYFVIPHKLLVGTRFSHGRLPLLGLAGRNLGSHPADRAMQVDAIVQLYKDGLRQIGLSYSLLDYNAKDAPDPTNDKRHTLMVEAQLVL